MAEGKRLKIAIIGTGVSGLSAAWLLSRTHEITVFEKDGRVGGHCNTLETQFQGLDGELTIPVDTGFIVYNERTYPNLTALFKHIGVATEDSTMSFSASLNGGSFEYSGSGLKGLLAQKRNLFRPRFWRMIWDIFRFSRKCVEDSRKSSNSNISLGDYLNREGYSDSFLHDHIYPMASSIWSASFEEIRAYPLKAFVSFFANHGLLETNRRRRPKWRTVTGGSRTYVERITSEFRDRIRINTVVSHIERIETGITLTTENGSTEEFDHVIIATHSNQALKMLSDPSAQEKHLLGSIRYKKNRALLHMDSALMPRRERAWASWNYISTEPENDTHLACLTYWMNSLQNIDKDFPIFVTLNPQHDPDSSRVIEAIDYEHPIFDQAALDAQEKLWELQGCNRTWYCGAYFGYGFHEDGLQSGLAVAEALSGLRRPWIVENESGRICISDGDRSTYDSAA